MPTKTLKVSIVFNCQVDESLGAIPVPDEAQLVAIAETLGKAIQQSVNGSVNIRYCGDAVMQSMNKTWRGKDKPTNVLSFPLQDHTDDCLGDLLLSWPMVCREAKEQGLDADHHAQHLVLHGLMHLLGYDHETDQEAETMEQLERCVMKALNLHDPYPEYAHDQG